MLGKILLTLSATALIVATPMADYNHTHIFNPLWKPHAKYVRTYLHTLGPPPPIYIPRPFQVLFLFIR